MPRPHATPEEGERLVVGVEYHLQALARISTYKEHPAVTEPEMGDLDLDRHAIELNHLMAPVELKGFPRRKAQRDVGRRRRLPTLIAPSPGVTAHGII